MNEEGANLDELLEEVNQLEERKAELKERAEKRASLEKMVNANEGITIVEEVKEDGKRALKEMVGTGFGVIYITESLYEEIKEEVEKEKSHRLPAIIPIPGISGNTGQGMRDVKRLVEQAVGSDIIFND